MHEQDLRDVARQARNVADLIRQRPAREQASAAPVAGRARAPDARLQSIEGLLVRVAIEIDEYLAGRRP